MYGKTDSAIMTSMQHNRSTPPDDKPRQQEKVSRQAQIETCGKCIISGEHSVVYGAKAIAFPLHSVEFSLKIAESKDSKSSLKTGQTAATPSYLPGLVKSAFELLQIPYRPLNLWSSSTIPVGAGLGSSAALCVALLKSIAKLTAKELSDQECIRLSPELETYFHGTPSGLDTTTVSLNKPISFSRNLGCTENNNSLGQKNPLTGTPALKYTYDILNFHPDKVEQGKNQGILSRENNRNWKLVLVDSNLRSATVHMVRHAKQFFMGQEGMVRLQAFDNCTAAIGNAFHSNDFDGIREGITENAHLLESIGVIPPPLKEQMQILLRLGAAAVKPTGAGGGGFLLTLIHPDAFEDFSSLYQSSFSSPFLDVSL